MSKHLTDYFSSITAKEKMITEAPVQPSTASTPIDSTSSLEGNDVWSSEWRLDWLKKHNPKKYKQIMGE